MYNAVLYSLWLSILGNEMFGRSRITTIFYRAVNGLIIQYPTFYDHLDTVKYDRNTAPTERVRYSLKQLFTTVRI
jgi:hypothetical protein